MSHKSYYTLLLNTIIIFSMIFSPLSAAAAPIGNTQDNLIVEPTLASTQDNNLNSSCASSSDNVTITTFDDEDVSHEINDVIVNQSMPSTSSTNGTNSKNDNLLLLSPEQLRWLGTQTIILLMAIY